MPSPSYEPSIDGYRQSLGRLRCGAVMSRQDVTSLWLRIQARPAGPTANATSRQAEPTIRKNTEWHPAS